MATGLNRQAAVNLTRGRHRNCGDKNRTMLDTALEKKKANFYTKNPLPDFPGWLPDIADIFEFSQAGESRLHDRFMYTKQQEELCNLNSSHPN